MLTFVLVGDRAPVIIKVFVMQKFAINYTHTGGWKHGSVAPPSFDTRSYTCDMILRLDFRIAALLV